MTNETKQMTITLTNRAPVRISVDAWPIIARGDYNWHDGQVECQANRKVDALLIVRRHANGRHLVHGSYSYGSNFQHEADVTVRAGHLLDVGESVESAITRVTSELVEQATDLGRGSDAAKNIRAMRAECIADLPAEELE